MASRTKIIAVDFDGTITEESEWPVTGRIRPEAIRVLKNLKKSYIILLWTARTGRDLEEALNLIHTSGIEIDYVNWLPGQTGNKPLADIFIDDRSLVSEVDWNKIEKMLL